MVNQTLYIRTDVFKKDVLSELLVKLLYILKETSRLTNIARENRTCVFCNLNDLEREYQFTLVCPVYNNIRKHYVQKHFQVLIYEID